MEMQGHLMVAVLGRMLAMDQMQDTDRMQAMEKILMEVECRCNRQVIWNKTQIMEVAMEVAMEVVTEGEVMGMMMMITELIIPFLFIFCLC